MKGPLRMPEMAVDKFILNIFVEYSGNCVSLQFELQPIKGCKQLKDMEIGCKYQVPLTDGWTPEGLRALLEGAKRTVVVAHTNADGDAVGSLTGLYAALRDMTGATVTPLLPDGCPDDLAWLPNTDRIIDCGRQPELAARLVAEADLVVATDLNGLDRTGRMSEAFLASKARKVLIDHHVGPRSEQFDVVVSDDGISSACELAYWTLRQTFGPSAIGREAAESFYTGICTDTGTFSYSNTRQSVYLAAAELLTRGIDPMAINRRIKNVFSVARLQFFGHAMSRLMTVYPEKQLALMVIRDSDMKQYGVESPELTGLVNEVMRLRDIDCAVLIREEERSVRLSLRSKEHIDVNLLARELFDGGGHERAAGATSHLSLDETVQHVKQKFDIS